MTEHRSDSDIEALASSLRLSVTRLARLLRQQDQSGLSPALATSLASIWRDGPLTLSRLAALEQVTPPTVTKLVEKLEMQGFIVRRTDPDDRRVCRVEVTPAGVTQLEQIRDRRTEWLSARLDALSADEIERLGSAIDVLEHLVRPAAEP